MNILSRAEAAAIGFRNRFGRALGWLFLAVLGAYAVGHMTQWGVDEYTARWAGACFKAASGAFGGYRVAKTCRIDPSMGADGTERALLHLARAIIVGAVILAICLAV